MNRENNSMTIINLLHCVYCITSISFIIFCCVSHHFLQNATIHFRFDSGSMQSLMCISKTKKKYKTQY